MAVIISMTLPAYHTSSILFTSCVFYETTSIITRTMLTIPLSSQQRLALNNKPADVLFLPLAIESTIPHSRAHVQVSPCQRQPVIYGAYNTTEGKLQPLASYTTLPEACLHLRWPGTSADSHCCLSKLHSSVNTAVPLDA